MTSSPETVLIVGASGFLGGALCGLPDAGMRLVPTVRERRRQFTGDDCWQMDITDPAQVDSVIAAVRPRWVINTAAATSVDGCEEDPAWAHRVHVDGTRHLVRACERASCGLITLSTNYVFDGTAGPYGEDDEPDPPNVYGRTKLEAEHLVLGAGCPGAVVRTAVLFGYRPGSRPNFLTWAVGSLARGERIRVVTDERANPTLVDDLAAFLVFLCLRDFQGLIHFAGGELLTRYEMVEQICACFGLDDRLAIPVSSAELAQKAPRPLEAGLTIDRARRLFDRPISSFSENLQRLSARIGDPARLGLPGT